jgi:hypothetical protein
MGEIANGDAKGERTYRLKMQSGVQLVRSRMAWQREKGHTI